MRIMEISIANIDKGKSFDWGKASKDYAKYRDIYPAEFYDKIIALGLCVKGQSVLDIGTGTGVLPRNMYTYGANWTGTDISKDQIEQAQMLSAQLGYDIKYITSSAEKLDFENGSFDVITACQCYWYFDNKITAPLFSKLLKPGGKVAFMVMNWLPYEDEIAKKSEDLVLKYNPVWTGAGETFHPINLSDEYNEFFDVDTMCEFRIPIHFTKDGWNGRMKACRGVGASSLTQQQIADWEKEHLEMLSEYPDEFDIMHYAAFAVLKKK